MPTTSLGLLAGVLLGVFALTQTAAARQGTVVGPAGPASTGASAGTPSPPASTLVAGRVVDGETGAPVPAAVVSIFTSGGSAGQQTPRVLTDSGGRFYFSGTAPGGYTIEANKAGWLPGAWGRQRAGGDARRFDLREDDVRGDVVIRMWRTAVISGRVTDESNDPLVGADVRIFRQSFEAGRRQFEFVARAVTDDRGDYRFSTLVPGDYLVVVPATVTSEPPELQTATSMPATFLRTMNGLGTAPLSLGNRADVSVGGGQALLSSPLGLPDHPLADRAWTTYATTYFPSVASISGAGAVRANAGHERANTDIVVRFTPTFRVSGTLNLPDGVAAPFHAVHLVPAETADHPLVDAGTAVTDARGAFTLFGVPAGEYVARVVRTPAPGAGLELGICGGTGAISYVCSVSRNPGTGPPQPSTDELLHVDQAVTVTDRDVAGVTMTLAVGASVRGRVEFDGALAAPTDEELRNMAVWLERADGIQFRQDGAMLQAEPARVGEDRRFHTPSSWPGRYVVRVTGTPKGWHDKHATYQGRDISETPLDLRSSVGEIVVTLTDRTSEISGSVQNANGQADASATVILFPADAAERVDYGRTSRRVKSVVAIGGRYALPAPPAGNYLLVAIPDEQAADWQNPAQLERLARLAERIRVADGQSLTVGLRTRRIP